MATGKLSLASGWCHIYAHMAVHGRLTGRGGGEVIGSVGKDMMKGSPKGAGGRGGTDKIRTHKFK